MGEGIVKYLRCSFRRKRRISPDELDLGNLKRCLTLWDLIILGLGSTLGVGVYVLIGAVSLSLAGPSIVLSFLIAAVVALFAGLCFAEFGSRVPRAGSAYFYTYVIIGEFPAFMIGWNSILETLFATASVARGFSLYVDSLFGNVMTSWFAANMPMNVSFLSPYFDLFSFLVVLVFGVALAYGVRESAILNSVFTISNLIVILFIIVAGSFHADVSNWSISSNQVPSGFGDGGFFPYGIKGMLQGAAICFYGFVGFENISASSEEVLNPKKAIPLATIVVLLVVYMTYAGVSIIITMMVPYYLHDKVSAVATSFSFVGWEWARWVVSVGAVFGICASLFGALFPLPRLLYAMSSDGLLLHWLSKVSVRRQTPVLATMMSCVITAFLAAIMTLKELILMSCIGTLLSYTMVAICIIMTRFKGTIKDKEDSFCQRFFGRGSKAPTFMSYMVAKTYTFLFVLVVVVLGLVMINVAKPMIPAIVLNVVALILMLMLSMQPKKNVEDNEFKTPLVPLIPCISIYANIHLMMLINYESWIRILLWIVLGIPLYIVCIFCYKRKAASSIGKADNGISNENGNSVKHTMIDQDGHSMNNKPNKEDDAIVREDQIQVETQEKTHNVKPDSPKLASVNIDVENKEFGRKEVEEMLVQRVITMTEINDDKEANIIDLLDKVIQAEEEAYGPDPEILLSDLKIEDLALGDVMNNEMISQRKSLSELSEAGSDASSNIIASKYDVVAQVHREDLPKLYEEPEAFENIDLNEHEKVTFFNESETSSRTDESGYSDTTDYHHLNESAEEKIQDSKESLNASEILPPSSSANKNLITSPGYKKSFTISARATNPVLFERNAAKHRGSIQSNTSQDENTNGNIVFGSVRQMKFMSKLNNIFQSKIPAPEDDRLKRCNSTGDVQESADKEIPITRSALFLDLKKELLSKNAPVLRSVKIEITKQPDTPHNSEEESEEEKETLSKEDLKSKLENILSAGGPRLLKPRLTKSNPPTPEEAQINSSTGSLPKPLKLDLNDTLKRQKDKFGEVLNSFRLSLNIDSDPL